MTRGVALSLVLAAAGCAAPSTRVSKTAEGVRLSSYARIGVMPFGGSSADPDAVAEELAKRLFRMRYSVVYGRQLRAALSQLGVQKGDSIGDRTLRELRRMTQIDALIVGALDCGSRSRLPRASALLIDANDNRILFETRFEPKECSSHEAPARVAEEISAALREALGREGKREMDFGLGLGMED